MENWNKKPIFIIAFFAFLIALFFAAEEMDFYPNNYANRLQRHVRCSQKQMTGLKDDLCHDFLCQVKKGAGSAKHLVACPIKKSLKLSKYLVGCPAKKSLKFAKHAAGHVRHLLPF
ncbi:MAG: hypothetical protein FWF59_10895 [Turicibacter sp.]|nr:hypothetical protein [Turicibacter sp.]